MSAIDLPDIHNVLRDRTPRTSHQPINRVVNRLSTRAGSSGADAHTAHSDHDTAVDEKDVLDTLDILGKN